MVSMFSTSWRILVTGASSGIGRSIALRLNRLGTTVLANGRDPARLEALREAACEPRRMLLLPRDLTRKMEDLPRWVGTLSTEHGKLSGLVCCAGIADPTSLQTYDLDAARRMYDCNVHAPLLLAQGFADRRHNVGAGSGMVFIASKAGVEPGRGQVAYAASKAALIAAARALSHELAPRGVRANCISPAAVVSRLTAGPDHAPGMDAFLEQEAPRYPLGLGEPKDVAALAVFLLSDEARWITGQNYILDGGRI